MGFKEENELEALLFEADEDVEVSFEFTDSHDGKMRVEVEVEE